MGILLNIKFDRRVLYAGQIVSGKVYLSTNDSLELRSINLSLVGVAHCRFWTRDHHHHRRDCDDWHTNTTAHGQEIFFRTVENLAVGGEQVFTLPVGEHVYPFSVQLPPSLPSTFRGRNGEIHFYGRVELDIPWAFNKTMRQPFVVFERPLDLRARPEFAVAYENSNVKVFCCLCCASRLLRLRVSVPRTGYNPGEVISVTIEVDNRSNVRLRSGRVSLYKMITWNARRHRRIEMFREHMVLFGSVDKHESRTWNERLPLENTVYDNTGNSMVIQIRYELLTVLKAPFPHAGLRVGIPIVIGGPRPHEDVPRDYQELPLTDQSQLQQNNVDSQPDVQQEV